MMASVKKFKDLKVNNTYRVLGFDGPNKSGYGDFYILEVKDEEVTDNHDDNDLEIYSTKYLAEYISTEKPTGTFKFTVNEKNNVKYPVIEGYKEYNNKKSILNFKDLEVSNTYYVLGFGDPINSIYGESYILEVKDVDGNEFKIWSTKSLAEYISTKKTTGTFKFTVFEKNNVKYPDIEGFKKRRNYTKLI